MSQRSFIFYLISIFAILNLSGSSKSSKSSLAPDFAFPQTVEKNANHDLTSALDKKDWNGVACAVVKSITASNLISRENVVAGLSRLDSISNSAPADWKPVFLLMQADIYGKIYESNRWDMDSRELPLDSFPKNPFDWSKDLIALKTLQLCTPIVEYSRSAKNLVSEWSSFLVDTSFASSMRMTTGEFLNLRSYYLLNRMSDSSSDIIPFFTTSTLPVTPTQKCANLRDRAIDILIDQASSSGNQSELLGEALSLKSTIISAYLRPTFLKDAIASLDGTPGQQRVIYQLIISNLRNYGNSDENSISKSELLDIINKSVAKFPNGAYANALLDTRNSLMIPSVGIEGSNRYLSTDSVKVSVGLKNCDHLYLLVYDFSPFDGAKENPTTAQITSRSRLIKATEVNTHNQQSDTTVEANLGNFSPGKYVIIPSATHDAKGIYPTISKYILSSSFEVSDITYYTLECPDGSYRVYIVDGKNGKPIEGAKVDIYEKKYWNSPKTFVKTLTTDKEGCVAVRQKDFIFSAAYNGSVCSSDQTLASYSFKTNDKERFNISFFTDRSLYHPGDSVDVACVAYSSRGYDVSLCQDLPVKISILNASRKEVASYEITLDQYSRGRASFRIPESGMLGRWTLSASTSDSRMNGNGYFQVADYVAPSFFITTDSDDAEVDLGSTARISGQILTYSGMPLPGAEVRYKVTYHPMGRFYHYSGASYESTVTTGIDGKYVIDLPTSNLEKSIFDKGIFSVSLSATSPAGETQDGPVTYFSIGKNYTISPLKSEAKFEISDRIPKLTFNVKNILGKDVNKELNYIVEDSSGNEVAKGSFMSPVLQLPDIAWQSEVYDIYVSLGDDETIKTEMKITLWKDSDTAAPKGSWLWTPQSNVIATQGSDNVRVKFGVSYPDSWIAAVVSGPDSLISTNWFHSDGELAYMDIPTPPSGSHYELCIRNVHNLLNSQQTIKIYPSDVNDNLKITTISFRDRLTAGDTERWSFKFSEGDLAAANIPVLAVMTDKSLNAIQNFSWHFKPSPYYSPSYYRLNCNYSGYSRSSTYILKKLKSLDFKIPEYPAINDYRQSWGLNYIHDFMFASVAEPESDYAVAGYGTMKRSQIASRNMALKEKAADVSSPELAEMVADKEQSDDSLDDENEIFTAAVETNGTEDGAFLSDSSDLREAQHPVAFFMPLLSTNHDGIVNIDFDVPNFNTTWAFQLLGYDTKLQTAMLELNAVASKPVMVRQTSPRFLRSGDKLDLTATLYNNSGDDCNLKGRIEILDPLSGKLIKSQVYEAENVAIAGSRVITMDWTVPTDLSQVEIRAYAEGCSHRDGERVIIPILPATSPVVESSPFWLLPGQEKFEIKLPEFKSSDQITLQYCDNPLWYCVSALPDITDPKSVSILAKARALYADMVAHHLISSHPSLKDGLQYMLSDRNSQFAALKSNLEKDGNIKITEIDNTPWINSAETETLRMSQLSSLLSDSIAESAISTLLDEIKNRQSSDGGWSWCPDMPSTEWMTREVVRYFALINKAGAQFVNDSDKSMVEKAIAYVDGKEVETYRKYHKKGDSLSYLLDWLYIRSFFPASMLSSGKDAKAFSDIASKALTDIENSWKNLSIDSKAKAATTLWRAGRQRTALLVLESLRQFASESPEKGVWFDNLQSSAIFTTSHVLEAFSEIQPENQIVDKLRQYLILSRQTQNWGASSTTAEVVNAILTSGSDWTKTESTPRFKLGGKSIQIPEIAAMTGAFTLTLDPNRASGSTLKIERDASSPAWGGVIAQYQAHLSDIKAADVPDLSVSKQIVALVPEGNGTMVPKEGIPLAKGMKVRVTLTINADRDMDYVMVRDERSACLEPVSQISSYTVSDGLWFYREVRNEVTNLFFNRLPKGHHVVAYDCWVTLPGTYSCGIAIVQSQYAPTEVAHSAATELTVR